MLKEFFVYPIQVKMREARDLPPPMKKLIFFLQFIMQVKNLTHLHTAI